MLPNLTNQYISYSMAVFSANEIRTFNIGTRKIKSIYLEAEGISKIFGEGEDISRIIRLC